MARLDFSIDDLREDPWSAVYMDVPHDADEDLLYYGYNAAQWCRQYLLDTIDEVSFHEGRIRDILKHSDIALKRMRELNSRLRDLY